MSEYTGDFKASNFEVDGGVLEAFGVVIRFVQVECLSWPQELWSEDAGLVLDKSAVATVSSFGTVLFRFSHSGRTWCICRLRYF